jgi:hypothetical protein
MEIVQNQVFNGETITIDDKHFVGCKLIECKLIYSGGEVQFTESPVERCPIVFSGPAQRTANLLVSLGAIPANGMNLPPNSGPAPKKPSGVQ